MNKIKLLLNSGACALALTGMIYSGYAIYPLQDQCRLIPTESTGALRKYFNNEKKIHGSLDHPFRGSINYSSSLNSKFDCCNDILIDNKEKYRSLSRLGLVGMVEKYCHSLVLEKSTLEGENELLLVNKEVKSTIGRYNELKKDAQYVVICQLAFAGLFWFSLIGLYRAWKNE